MQSLECNAVKQRMLCHIDGKFDVNTAAVRLGRRVFVPVESSLCGQKVKTLRREYKIPVGCNVDTDVLVCYIKTPKKPFIHRQKGQLQSNCPDWPYSCQCKRERHNPSY